MTDLICDIKFDSNSLSISGVNCETSIIDGKLHCTPKDDGWINVNEKLPPESKRVIINCDEGICTGYYSYGSWQCDPTGSYASDGWVFCVTHWCELPEPPKEKNNQ